MNFQEKAQVSAEMRKKSIVLIPNNIQIDAKHLGGMSNGQFVENFRELQMLLIRVYDDVVKDPFEWGYPDFETTDGYYNRIIDLLFALVQSGEYQNGVLTVDTKAFTANINIKRHKKWDLMLSGLEKMGFCVEGFHKKSTSFTVFYPPEQGVAAVLNAYVRGLDERSAHWSMHVPRNSLSYRLVEDEATQEYETAFLAKMDVSASALREIQYWLHEKAGAYGYKMDIHMPFEKDCVLYRKGSKGFLLVGEREVDGVVTVFSKVIFRDVFFKAAEQVRRLKDRFPDAFRSNCTLCNGSKAADSVCSMRICYDVDGVSHRNCAYNSFYFYNPTLEDIQALTELFIVENKVKL